MNLSITEELKATFHLAALRHQTKTLLTGRQWERRGEIETRCERAREKADHLFEKRFDTRIANEQKRLINEAGSKTDEFKPNWAQDDVFDKTASLAQADKNVRANHANRIARINQYEQRGLEMLLQSARAENKIQGKPTREFNHKTDRRFADRRIKPSRTQTR